MKFKLVEDYLNEAKDWYEISGGANNYYIYGTSVTDAEHTANRILGRIPKEGTFKQSFDKDVLASFITDYSPIANFITSKYVTTPTTNILTAKERQLRREASAVAMSLDNIARTPKFKENTPYVHHIDGKEYNNGPNNLLAWKNSEYAGIIHRLAHLDKMAPHLFRIGTYSEDVFVWDSSINDWKRAHTIEITVR